LALGALVTGTGSGLGCGDHWPSCNGQLIPDLSRPTVVIEFAHRLVAALVGILSLWMVLWIWRLGRRSEGANGRMLRPYAGAALLLLLAQILLGAFTVKLELPPEIVMLHLATGMAFFAMLVILRVLLAENSPDSAGSHSEGMRLHYAALISTLAVYLQIVLGAYVRHSGAALACPDFPLCQGALVPHLSGLTLIQFTHRLGALLVAGLIFWLAWRARPASLPAVQKHLARWAALLILLQIALGGLTVLSGLAPLWATAHLATAAALLGVLLALTLRSRSVQQSAAAAPLREVLA